jgi:PAS domain-containing protein
MNPAQVSTSFHASMFQAWSAFSDEFVAVWDDAGMDLLFFNEAYLDFFGYTSRVEFEAVYSFFGCRKHKLDSQLEAVMRSSIQQHGVWTEEVLLEKKNWRNLFGKVGYRRFCV